MAKKNRKTGFQFPGQVPLEDFDKIKAPRGKFIVVERSENNITGWGYTIVKTLPTRRKALLAVTKIVREQGNYAASHSSITMGRAIDSICILVINSEGQVLREL